MKYSLHLILLAFLFAVSCNEETADPKASGILEVTGSWARPAASGMTSAAYLTISNGTSTSDTLLSVESDISDDVQIHESYQNEEGLMAMRPVGLVPVQSESSVEFRQGGLHIMIIQPEKDLLDGDSLKLNLQFSHYGVYDLMVPIQSQN